jgi:hypothetical protein
MRIVARMEAIEDLAAAIVEALAFTLETVPQERCLALLQRSGDAFTKGDISEVATNVGRSLLDRTAIAPIAPKGQPRTGEQLRAFLDRWLGPASSTGVRHGDAASGHRAGAA